MDKPINSIRAAGSGLEILVYGDIDAGFARSIVEQLQAADRTAEIALRINSPGGAVVETLAALNALRSHPARVVVHIDGLAASAASLLAMAGNRIIMADNALMMIHDPWASTAGNADELRRLADTLDKHRDAMVGAYQRSGLSRQKIIDLMRAETWFNAEEALAAGFVDEITEGTRIAAQLDLSQFPNAPQRKVTMDKPNPKDAKPAAPDDSKLHVVSDAVAADRERIQARNDHLMTMRRLSRDPAVYAEIDLILADTCIPLDQALSRIQSKLPPAEPLGPSPGWAPDFEMAHGKGSVAMPGTNRHVDEFQSAVCDALLMRYGVPVKEPHPGARDVRNMSAVEVGSVLLSQRGRVTRGWGKGEIAQAALTTSDLPQLLENVAHKALMTGFRETEAASHRAWVREGSLDDFKTASRVALSEAPGLELVREHGEYTEGALSDEKETIQLATYGKIVSLTRQAIINDDLGELTRLPFAMGQASARREADLVYGLLTTNPTMRDSVALFDAAHGNVGTGAALAVASLGEARALMRVQKGLGGVSHMNIAPRYLIVPAALETTAEQLITTIQPATAANAIPEWVRRLVVVVDARLDDDSETAWYLAGDQMAYDTVEIARLTGDGAEVLTEDGFTTDTVRFKVRLDVGAAVLDWRALTYNAGA